MGAKNIEIVCGTLQPGHGTLPHAHPGIEQVCYVLEGAALAGIDGQRQQPGPAIAVIFLPTCSVSFPAVGGMLCKVLIICSLPYEEDSGRVIR